MQGRTGAPCLWRKDSAYVSVGLYNTVLKQGPAVSYISYYFKFIKSVAYRDGLLEVSMGGYSAH